MSARYITTTLPYVNSFPHVGFALEVVHADALARSWRAAGEEVFFNTGTDEHGQKILEAAEKSGQEVQKYVDHYAAEFKKLKEVLNLSNDAFIRTTDEYHIKAAQEMWKRCDTAGDIYKKAYEGLYCVGCEKFLTERDMQDGKCTIHGKEPVMLKEENYFFRLSKYQDKLVDYLSRPGVIVPEWRREEALNFVKSGLEDFSISRERERLSWGVPVPGDDSQVFYVWFDALTNYISTLGWPEESGNFEAFWKNGTVLQMAGKDQVRFQSVMWQAMLMSADIKNTDTVFYHGFVTSDGQKMSKSIGNVISPYELVQKYGTEATRFQLLRNVHPYQDTDITWERLDEWYTALLVNGLGNVVARIMQMAQTHLDEPVEVKEIAFKEAYEKLLIEKEIDPYRFDQIVDQIAVGKVNALDALIADTEPFKLIKTDRDQAIGILEKLVRGLYEIGVLLKPYMPATSAAILAAVKANKKPENLFPRLS